jgi:hypothetical protein
MMDAATTCYGSNDPCASENQQPPRIATSSNLLLIFLAKHLTDGQLKSSSLNGHAFIQKSKLGHYALHYLASKNDIDERTTQFTDRQCG